MRESVFAIVVTVIMVLSSATMVATSRGPGEYYPGCPPCDGPPPIAANRGPGGNDPGHPPCGGPPPRP